MSKSYVKFVHEESLRKGGDQWDVRTTRHDVRTTRDDDYLGSICWYGGWKCYVFRPATATEYSADCLRDIADFLEMEWSRNEEA